MAYRRCKVRFDPISNIRAYDAEGRPLYFAELFIAPGPQQLAVTGDASHNTLFGSDWLTFIERGTRILRAFQYVAGEWIERTYDPEMPAEFGTAVPADAERLSHAFDQSARLIYGYRSGIVKVTRWDSTSGAYIQNVSFTGINPTLLMQATLDYRIPGSDVWIFYQKEGDPSKIYYRVQREIYGTEHELYDHTDGLILDRAQALAYRYQLLVSDASGVPLDALQSELYDIYLTTLMTGQGQLANAIYTKVKESYTHTAEPDVMSGSGKLLNAAYENQRLILDHTAEVEKMTGAGQLLNAIYESQRLLFEHTAEVEKMTGSGQLRNAEYQKQRSILSHTADIEKMTGEGKLTNAIYQEV